VDSRDFLGVWRLICRVNRLEPGIPEEDTRGAAAADVRRLIAALEQGFPGIGPELEREMAVAIDGQIYQDPFLERIAPDSEVYFLPCIGGG